MTEITFPEIQAYVKKEGAAIFFADEASMCTDYHAGTTWASVGLTPIVKGSGKRSVVMLSAVSARGELHLASRKKASTDTTSWTLLRS